MQVELKRELARRRLTDYSQLVFGFTPAAHQQEWISLLEDERIERLLIIAPPESAKSTYCSVIFPSWWIGRNPTKCAIMVSCTATQAEEFHGAVVRTIENDPEFKAVFPHIHPWKEAGWTKTHIFVKRPNIARPDPTLMATGCMGPIIGRRADLIIVDDPTDQDIAYSELQRERQKQWFKQTLMTRLVEGGRMIVILTRWHEDDLAAELMKPEMNFTVRHLSCFQNGGSYWPEVWSMERLEMTRQQLGSSIFRCMFLGDPIDVQGMIFRREWFRYYDVEPKLRVKMQSWDTALTATKKSDYNVCITGGVDEFNRIYITDVYRQQMEAPDLHKSIINNFYREGPIVVLIEDKISGTTAIQTVQRQALIPIQGVKPEKGKALRARGVTPFFERGEVYFRAGAPWLDELEHELTAFPVGKYDDQVDALVQLINGLVGGSSRLAITESSPIGFRNIREKRF